MARHESDFRSLTEEPLGLHELLDLLGNTTAPGSQARQEAIACFLSGSDGWRDAVRRLGGAFAESETGLKERKSD